MYLYLGYLLIQLYSVVDKLFQSNLSISVIVFSVIVLFLWSLIPFIGYGLAKILKANGKASKPILFALGMGIGLIENSLFYFDLLTKNQNPIGTLVVFILFFTVAFVSINTTKFARQNEHY